MKKLDLPFDIQRAQEIIGQYGSPVYVYDERGIRETARALKDAFAWADGYKNYFAVKATPTPAIIKILVEEGMGVDCSSRTELLMAQRLGLKGDEIFYTSNNTPREDFELAIELDATVNIDDLRQVEVFTDVIGDRELSRVAVRYNPGDVKSGNAIIGEPLEAKYGMSLEQMSDAFKKLSGCNIKSFGLHTMVASNERDPSYFSDTARLLIEAKEAVQGSGAVKLDFINIGGGFGVNYRPEEHPFDLEKASELIRMFTDKVELKLFSENGRYVTGPHGYLLTRVRYVMNKYKNYLGVDASMHNLMRPGMYGAYHYITVLGKEQGEHEHVYDVVGSLCENNDKFAIDRALPEVAEGDVLVVHDVGAHGHAMGFNYNGLLRSAEVLLREDGGVQLIRKAETEDDYFAPIVWDTDK